jgi:hypothetical protein
MTKIDETLVIWRESYSADNAEIKVQYFVDMVV